MSEGSSGSVEDGGGGRGGGVPLVNYQEKAFNLISVPISSCIPAETFENND